MKPKFMKLSALVFTLALGLSLAAPGGVEMAHAEDKTKAADVQIGVGGEYKFVQFVANGSEPANPSPFIDIAPTVSCANGECDVVGSFACFENIGEDLNAQQDRLDDFRDYTLNRFGADIADGTYFIFAYEAREAVGIEAIAVSGLNISNEGNAVEDCGFLAFGQNGSYNQGFYVVPELGVIDYKLMSQPWQLAGWNGDSISLGFYEVTANFDGQVMTGTSSFVTRLAVNGGDFIYRIVNTMTFPGLTS